MSLKIELRYDEDNNLIVVIPEGDIDIYTSQGFKEKVLNFLKKTKEIYLLMVHN